MVFQCISTVEHACISTLDARRRRLYGPGRCRRHVSRASTHANCHARDLYRHGRRPRLSGSRKSPANLPKACSLQATAAMANTTLKNGRTPLDIRIWHVSRSHAQAREKGFDLTWRSLRHFLHNRKLVKRRNRGGVSLFGFVPF